MMQYYSSTHALQEMPTVLYSSTIDTTSGRCAVDVVAVVDRFCGFESEQIPRIKSVIVLYFVPMKRELPLG